MAYLAPDDLPPEILKNPQTPEQETLAILRPRLSSDYTVFHGVHWTNEYRNKPAFGEIDFVIVSPTGQTLLIEQKNGPVEETDEGLVKHYGPGHSKNVGAQIRRSIDQVKEKFRKALRHHIDLDYLIYIPDHHLRSVNAAALDR